MTLNSAEVIVMCAYGAHFIKEVARKQLAAAAKTLLSREGRSLLQGADENQFF